MVGPPQLSYNIGYWINPRIHPNPGMFYRRRDIDKAVQDICRRFHKNYMRYRLLIGQHIDFGFHRYGSPVIFFIFKRGKRIPITFHLIQVQEPAAPNY